MASTKIKQILETIPTGLVKEVPMKMAKIEFSLDKKTEMRNAVITGADGKPYTVNDPISYDLLYYWRSEPEVEKISFRDMKTEDLNAIVAKLISRSPKEIKLQLDAKGTVISVRSKRAQQINWQEAMRSVFKGIEQTYKLGPDDVTVRGTRAYNVKLPIQTKMMAFFCEVWSGSNIGRDKARTIELRVRGQTIAPLKGMEKACLNWCTFRDAKYWFGINTAHINDVGKLGKLSFRTIHTKSGEEKMDKIVDVFKAQKADVQEAATLIDKYVHTPLMKDEMDTIVKIYVEKFGLPKYVAKDIPTLIKEPTVWGLSNAFSFFRTHCEYKKSKADKETSSLTDRLEHIAGELIVVSPLIKSLKDKEGKITRDILLPSEKKKEAIKAPTTLPAPIVTGTPATRAPPTKPTKKPATVKAPAKAKAAKKA